MSAKQKDEVEWRDWSPEAFEEARRTERLVLLDLTASWCHWCHVMDSTTYSDPAVIELVNDNFVPVRVDIDRRPDISERYNRGGFPTTAFLSDRAEPVWGATYIPPAEMKRIMSQILDAKSSGSIAEALADERVRDAVPMSVQKPPTKLTPEGVNSLFEGIFSTYDVLHGGFGTEPKFPHPESIQLLLDMYRREEDPTLAEAVRHSLFAMAQGLYDRVEGGVFRYSVTADWSVPHYEKMLETNAAFLTNLAHAHALIQDERFVLLAEGVTEYILSKLRDPDTHGFFGSQGADEDYYKLSEDARKNRAPPPVDHVIYAGWNAEAASALIKAGVVFGEERWIDAGLSAWEHIRLRFWNADLSLVGHSEGQELYLLEDQVSFLRALIAVAELNPREELFELGRTLIGSVERNLALPDGGYGDVIRTTDAVGNLERPQRSLITNSQWATAVALFSAAARSPELVERAEATLRAFSMDEVRAYGRFAAPLLSAWHVLNQGPVRVEVHAPADGGPLPEFWTTAKLWSFPWAVVMLERDDSTEAFAVVCDSSSCSAAIRDLDALRSHLVGRRTSQA